MADFAYEDLLPIGADETPYRLLTTEGVRTVEGPGGRTFLEVGPEALRLRPGPNPVSARIDSVTFLGTQTRVSLTSHGLTLQALTTPGDAASLTTGAEVTVSLPPESLWLLPVA